MNKKENKISRIFGNWVFSLNSIGTAWIFLIMLLINADVFLRFLFRMPIDGVTEIVSLSIVGIVFLQLSDAVRAGRLTRSDGFFNQVVEKKPKIGAVLSIFFDICGVIFFSVILFGAVPFFVDAWTGGYFIGTEGIFTFPKWPVRLILVISCFTVILVFLEKIIKDVSALMHSEKVETEEGVEL